MVNFHYLISGALLLLQVCAGSDQVDIYYDGFWTKHRVYQNESQLVASAKIKMTNLDLKIISDEASIYLFDNYMEIEKADIPQDIIFLVVVRSSNGNIVRKIIGDSTYLYDVNNNLFKVLDDEKKNFLRCYFSQALSDTALDIELKKSCDKYDY